MNNVKSVNVVFLITFLLSVAGSYVVQSIFEYTDNYFFVLLASQVILIVPSVFYLSAKKLNVAKTIRFNKIKPSNILLIIIFAYTITPVMNFVNALSMVFVQNTTANVMKDIVNENGLLLSLFMVALIPCIFEESVYRGIFYNEYSKVSPLKAIFLSGFLFGIIHGNLNQFSYAFLMGIVFALLIEATNSILSTMIVHFLINGTSIVMLALFPVIIKSLGELIGPSEEFNADELINSFNSAEPISLTISDVIRTYGMIAIVGAILSFIILRTIAKNSGRWEYIKGIFTGKSEEYVSKVRDNNDYNQLDDSDDRYNLEQYGYGQNNLRSKRLITISLGVAIVLCVGLMIFEEIYTRIILPNQL